MIEVKNKNDQPVSHLSDRRLIQLQVEKEYYQSKINCLEEMDLPLKLVLLACWDAPVSRANIKTKWGRKRFIAKCVKYYRKQLKALERKERQFRKK